MGCFYKMQVVTGFIAILTSFISQENLFTSSLHAKKTYPHESHE